MSHPFKVGDKVVRLPEFRGGAWPHGGAVLTVVAVGTSGGASVDYLKFGGSLSYDTSRFRAAVAGQDYAAPEDTLTEHYLGHMDDGSSVQKHSAGPLYPCVLVYRDKVLGGKGKYDVGIISPRNQEPMWFSSLETAAAVAEQIKGDLS